MKSVESAIDLHGIKAGTCCNECLILLLKVVLLKQSIFVFPMFMSLKPQSLQQLLNLCVEEKLESGLSTTTSGKLLVIIVKFLAFFRIINSCHYCENLSVPLEQCNLLKILSDSSTLFQHPSKLLLNIFLAHKQGCTISQYVF